MYRSFNYFSHYQTGKVSLCTMTFIFVNSDILNSYLLKKKLSIPKNKSVKEELWILGNKKL